MRLMIYEQGLKLKEGISFSIARNFHFATSFGGVAIIGMVVRIKSASQPKLHQQKKRGKRIKNEIIKKTILVEKQIEDMIHHMIV